MPYENHRTRVEGTSFPQPRPHPLEMREAFLAAYSRLSALAHGARRPAVLVAAVDGHARVVEVACVESGHSLIIGRHTGCGLRLPCDTLSLRHLVAHARSEPPDTAPVLWLWDLNTGQGFMTEDGQSNEAVMAQGPLYAAVGPYALLFIPIRGRAEASWPARAEEAWRALPPRQFMDRRHPDAARLRRPGRLRPDGREYQTDISRVGPLLSLTGREDRGPAWGELLLVRDGDVERQLISRERLEQGVLLGRYDRCAILLSGLDCISRVHLLLVRLGEDVLAIDTASSNGTWRGRKEIGTASLRNPDVLGLGRRLQLHWRRLASGTTDRES